MIQQVTCSKCGIEGTAMKVEYNGKTVVFDACSCCGTKLTNWEET